MSLADADRLAAKLGRPAASLPVLLHLTPEQVAVLSDLVDATLVRRRQEVDSALDAAAPAVPRTVLERALRRRR